MEKYCLHCYHLQYVSFNLQSCEIVQKNEMHSVPIESDNTEGFAGQSFHWSIANLSYFF